MRTWTQAAAIRAVKTMAQAAIAMIGTAAIISEVDWRYVFSAVALSGILSVLTSLAGLPEVDERREYDEIEVVEAKEDNE